VPRLAHLQVSGLSDGFEARFRYQQYAAGGDPTF
jgi:hypothetical protein